MSKNYFFKDDKILLEYYPELTTIESILNQLDKETSYDGIGGFSIYLIIMFDLL